MVVLLFTFKSNLNIEVVNLQLFHDVCYVEKDALKSLTALQALLLPVQELKSPVISTQTSRSIDDVDQCCICGHNLKILC